MPEKFVIKQSKDNQYYFVLVAPNGEVIATSEMYTTKAACEHGIEAVKKYATTAQIEEQIE